MRPSAVTFRDAGRIADEREDEQCYLALKAEEDRIRGRLERKADLLAPVVAVLPAGHAGMLARPTAGEGELNPVPHHTHAVASSTLIRVDRKDCQQGEPEECAAKMSCEAGGIGR